MQTSKLGLMLGAGVVAAALLADATPAYPTDPADPSPAPATAPAPAEGPKSDKPTQQPADKPDEPAAKSDAKPGDDADPAPSAADNPQAQRPAPAEGRDASRPGAPPPRPLSPPQLAQALEVLERIDPEATRRIRESADEEPAQAAGELRRRIPRLESFLRLREHDPEMFELRVEDLRLGHVTEKLARKLRDSADAEGALSDAEAVRNELRGRLAEQFDIRQRIQERELANLERRIEDIRNRIRQRNTERQALIDQRYDELAGEGDKSNW